MKAKIYFAVLVSVFLSLGLFATKHTITFISYSYTPNTLTVNVGDTVIWSGDFGSHPLESTSIPSGANPFSNGSGTSFSYIVMEAGTYNYQCATHGITQGMTGAFTALGALSVAEASDNSASVNVSFRKGSVQIGFANKESKANAGYTVRINNILGQPVWNQEVQPQESALNMSTEEFSAGVYVLNIASGSKTILTRKFVVQ